MDETDDAPPSYTSVLTQPTSLTTVLNPLQSHLRTLPARIKHSTAMTHSAQADFDLDILSFILPHVEAFLLSSDIAAARAGVAQLVVVPGGAVPAPWALGEVEERRRVGEVVRVGRVDVAVGHDRKGKGEKGEKDGKGRDGGRDREFDDWGRWKDDGEAGEDEDEAAFWWRDEGMARRLAAYLQPKEQVKTERREVRAEVVQQQKDRKGLFGGWGRKAAEAKPAAAVPADARGPVGPALPETEGVSMTVRAKEVTFRKENEFGIWESMSGYGIVVTIRVRKTGGVV
ncbi:hypothetical protein CONLIGDRAFT_657957 [Coniochaeta ligniaria NRRL 30616]|uniref:Uncharacterized protein n=1 Tax=Coniochaeta ligniaria NRRL 30616 TaxID=1408157 RepID=A0A1J7I689_9PEZI|nr:hypothetical protein CONLIGDRAFT_657957 [Coniochaeta ligniaria NRRL 30616]